MSSTMPRNRLFLRQPQIADLEGTIRSNEAKLSNPHITDKPAVRKQTQRLRKQLEEQKAPELDPMAKDAVAKRAKDLEASIREGMPSHEEMRKNPNGAIGAHQRWEKAKKGAVIEWKNCMVALNPGDTDPELSSVDRLRPTTSHLGMHSAQIPGKTFSLPSEEYKANYDDVFKQNTPEPKPGSMVGKPRGSNLTPEARKASSDRMKARWAAKKAAQVAAAQSESGSISTAAV